MSDAINAIFVGTTEELRLIDVSFLEKYNIRIGCKTADHGEAVRRAVASAHSVVVIRVNNTAEMKKLAAALTEKGIKYICICRTAKEGFEMLQYGAAEMITRTEAELRGDHKSIESVLASKIKTAHAGYFMEVTRPLKAEYGAYKRIIAIGSSTGGTETVLSILRELPADAPPVLVVQHMPPVFTRLYAERLHKVCRMSVWEAQDGDLLKRGLALIAPGDLQMTLENKSEGYRVRCQPGDKESGHCPSVDKLFRSVAATAGGNAIGVILTGMGRDGAKGMLEMRKKGACTLGQDERSCVVYGMPKEAYDIGAVERQLPANEIARAIMECITHG